MGPGPIERDIALLEAIAAEQKESRKARVTEVFDLEEPCGQRLTRLRPLQADLDLSQKPDRAGFWCRCARLVSRLLRGLRSALGIPPGAKAS